MKVVLYEAIPKNDPVPGRTGGQKDIHDGRTEGTQAPVPLRGMEWSKKQR
jgi:hypothetical protein